MDNSAAVVGCQSFHVRSISMPARSHPAAVMAEEELHKLKACVATPSSTMTYKEICQCLKGAEDLYASIDELLHLPSIQRAFSHPNRKNCLEKELDVSLRLLDLCGATKDVLLTFEGQVQELQSDLRRRGQVATVEEVRSHIYRSNKESQKIVKKTQRELKQLEIKGVGLVAPTDDEEGDLSMATRVLKEAVEITISLLSSIILYLSSVQQKPKACKWSFLLAKAIQKKKKKKKVSNCEVEPEDTSSVSNASSGSVIISLKELEVGLEFLFRRLVQNRVSLLNSYSQ